MSELKFATLNTLDHTDSIEWRFPGICQDIKKRQFDIITLQELILEKTAFYEAKLEEIGYKLVVNQRMRKVKGTWRHAPANNVGIAYNTKTVKLSSAREYDFANLMTDLEFLPTGDILTVFSYHGHWGTANLKKRLDEVVKISNISSKIQKTDPNRIIILAGDFNSVPGEESVQYLRGNRLYRGQNTYWTDWHMIQDKIVKTAKNYGENAIRTSTHVNIVNIDMMPMRTIDYIMTYGWNYGKRGGFANQGGIWADDEKTDLSDHLGLWGDIQL